MGDALYQNDKRWAQLLLGNGPSHIGSAGCVLTALAMAARVLGSRPDLLPPHANTSCLIAEAFARDELIVPRAALALGLLADAQATVGLPGDPTLVIALARAVEKGVALTRVDIDLNASGDHTILVHCANDDGTFACLCPAIGPMQLSKSLEATVAWGKGNLKKYRVVGVRGVTRPAS